jgi:hypothetical protein
VTADFLAVLDACVLVQAPLRDTLLKSDERTHCMAPYPIRCGPSLESGRVKVAAKFVRVRHMFCSHNVKVSRMLWRLK